MHQHLQLLKCSGRTSLIVYTVTDVCRTAAAIRPHSTSNIHTKAVLALVTMTLAVLMPGHTSGYRVKKVRTSSV